MILETNSCTFFKMCEYLFSLVIIYLTKKRGTKKRRKKINKMKKKCLPSANKSDSAKIYLPSAK